MDIGALIEDNETEELLQIVKRYFNNDFELFFKHIIDEGYIANSDEVLDSIYEIFPKQEDAKIADAILELFRKREHLDVFNKKALYIYIREIIDVKTPKITKIANKLYDIFKEGYVFYLEHGYTKF